jgi:hypothetical protein
VWRQYIGYEKHEGFVNGIPIVEWTRSGWGYFAQASQMLHRLVQITARWEQLFALDPTDPQLETLVAQQGHQAGAGLNLFLNGHRFKLQTDYFYIFGHDAALGRHVLRLQLDATF